MTTAPASASASASSLSRRWLFTATICTGSFLLFLVQPMIARMALPRLGGAPSVWNSAMLVYQALLLGGYAYAHWIGRFGGRAQSLIHLTMFAVAAVMLPIGLSNGEPPVDANPYFWVPWLLLTSMGPLFFVIAAQAPLIQRWYTLAGGGDPYPLYAASNLGSFGGLVAYPLLVEPMLTVNMQSMVWSVGYGLLAALVLVCALRLPRGGAEQQVKAMLPRIPAGRWMQWIGLAAIPSGLMLATTLHLTTDIVAMPLLWVIPLGLYLLSFSVAFSSNRKSAGYIARIAPVTLLISAAGVFVEVTTWQLTFAAITLLNLFVVSVALHSAMFDRRPRAEQLTSFYLAMSIGGVVGGIFCAIVSPLLFDWTYEYPLLMLAAAFAFKPQAIFSITDQVWQSEDAGRVARIGFILILVFTILGQGGFGMPEMKSVQGAIGLSLIGLGIFALGNRLLYVVALGALMLTMNGWAKLSLSAQDGVMTRSFFGIYAVRPSGNAKMLVHGTTVHGIQNLGSAALEKMPNTYYAPESGVGLALRNAQALYGQEARIGIVGLGTGTLACYTQPGEAWTYYEIDPVIEGIARDPKRFTFLSRCNPGVSVKIGDARLTLSQEPPASADVLVVDAFSSDAVPMHLLTAEAFSTYRRKIGPDGLLMVHISNRYLDLQPVVAAAARAGWSTRLRAYRPTTEDETKYRYTASNWIALSPSRARLESLIQTSGAEKWAPLPDRRSFDAWTDNYASILPILKFKRD